MDNNKRMYITMRESDIDMFERKAAEMKMNKSMYLRYLIAEHENKIPYEIKHRKLIAEISELNSLMRQIVSSSQISEVTRLELFEKIDKLIETLNNEKQKKK